jgi:hypothetical protein
VTQSPDPPKAKSFVLPTSCSGLVGEELTATFLADGNKVLTSDDGTAEFGNGNVTSTQEGGTPFSCWYGVAAHDLSDFEIAVQPLTHDAHEGTLATLQAGDFVETTDGEIVTFTQEGVEGTSPAIVHVLHPDGWITIARFKAGPAGVATINSWLPTITESVYP